MPAMDGYAVLRALQADPETARCPVVFLSGHRDFSERVRAFRVGVVDYLTKPFTRDVLLKKIERVLEARGRRPEPPVDRPARTLLDEVQPERRTGGLPVRAGGGGAEGLRGAGQVVDAEAAPRPGDPGRQGSSEELGAETTHNAAADAAWTRASTSESPPTCDQLPPLVRGGLVVEG